MCMKYDWCCYAGKDVRMNLCNDDKDTKAYKDEYISFLSNLWNYIGGREKWSGGSKWGPYEDPDAYDSRKGMRINPKFYSNLCDFLKIRAEDENDKKYEFKDNFIKYGDINLVSDQFGFSAPSLKLSHPYDIYLQKCKEEGKDKDEAIKKVLNWVMESRTIGGSFLWPEGIWTVYNRVRGGSKSLRGGSYIEDRVDLTLLEIKHYFDNENCENNILHNNIKEGSVEEKWIRDFGSFERYVDYFCFDPFVYKKSEDNYIPYDIAHGGIVKSKMVDGEKNFSLCINKIKINYRNRKENSIYKLSTDDLERMFNNVNYMIKERSKMMIEMLNARQSPSD